MRYMAGFADGHLNVDFDYSHSQQRWPGLIVARIGGRYLVTGRAKTWPVPLPAKGVELVSCNGRAPDTLMNEDVLPSLFNLTGLDSVKSTYAHYLFRDDEILPHQYAKCVFADSGARQEWALQWEPIRRYDYFDELSAATPSVSKESSVTMAAADTAWIRLPQFSPAEAEEAALMRVPAAAAKVRGAAVIVFDLRGNQGGNSKWGTDVLQGVYGKAHMDYFDQKQGSSQYVEYRVSENNARHAEHYIPIMARQFGADSATTRQAIDFARRMRAALVSGAPFVRQDSGEGSKPLAAASAPLPLSQARAVLLTDSGCVSSCLDFADAVLRLPNVRHVGETTGADTLFMEVRKVPLPSGLGQLILAQKVYRGRQRGSNQPWTPSLTYDGAIGDTASVQAWVLKNAR